VTTYDLLVFAKAAGPGGTTLLRYAAGALPDATAAAAATAPTVAGPAKLGQRFLLELLTEKGSMRFRPGRGSSLPAALRSGRLDTEADVFVAFGAALQDVEANLLADEADDDPDDERYAGAELTRVVLGPTSVTLTARVTSRAGATLLVAAAVAA
jgi:hypothetical protein